MKIKTEKITPLYAEKILILNPVNRIINEPTLKRYMDDMINGRWKEDTGEAIKIAKNGRLLDGQHRLIALVKTGLTFNFLIISELDEEIFDVIDTGKQRNATDVFRISGIKNQCKIPSIINNYYFLKNNTLIAGKQKNNRLTNALLLEKYYEKEIYWQDVTSFSTNCYTKFSKILQISLIGGFYSFFSEIDKDLAVSFFNQLSTGSDVRNNTISLLRQKLIADKLSPRKMPLNLKSALIIKTWNAARINLNLKILKFDIEREKYPVAL